MKKSVYAKIRRKAEALGWGEDVSRLKAAEVFDKAAADGRVKFGYIGGYGWTFRVDIGVGGAIEENGEVASKLGTILSEAVAAYLNENLDDVVKAVKGKVESQVVGGVKERAQKVKKDVDGILAPVAMKG